MFLINEFWLKICGAITQDIVYIFAEYLLKSNTKVVFIRKLCIEYEFVKIERAWNENY